MAKPLDSVPADSGAFRSQFCDGANEVVNKARYECGLARLAQPCDRDTQCAIMQERRQCWQVVAPNHSRQITVISQDQICSTIFNPRTDTDIETNLRAPGT